MSAIDFASFDSSTGIGGAGLAGGVSTGTGFAGAGFAGAVGTTGLFTDWTV
jgi:hypothetical protein